MTLSKAQIYNITLNILGVSVPVENINGDDNRAILLNNYYNLARDCVLRDFDWNFASTLKQLSLIEKDNDIYSYKYVFDYPNDCIFARDIFEKGSYVLQKFSVSSLLDGKKIILCDVENPVLRYTRRIEKEIFFSCEFSMALSYFLASLTANVITGSMQKADGAYQKYQKILSHARMLNAQEGGENLYDENTYLDSRG